METYMLFLLLTIFMHNFGNVSASLGPFGTEFVAVDNCSRDYMDILRNRLGCIEESLRFCTYVRDSTQGKTDNSTE